MHAHDAQVIIVGAGPVGLSAALDLAHHGVRSLILEKRPEPSSHARAAGILPHTLEIFATWGLLERFRAEGQWMSEINLWRADTNKPIANLSFAPLARMTSTPGLLVLPQNRTEAILEEAALASGRVEMRRGHAVVGMQQDSRGVEVQVAPVDETAAYTVRGRYLVACDGFRSTVRSVLGWELEGKTYPGRFLVADLQVTDSRDALPSPRVLQMGRHLAMAVRMGPRLWRVMGVLDSANSEDSDLEQAQQRRVEALLGSGPVQTLWHQAFVVHCRTSPRFNQGRVLLAGDAAHVNSPVGGQGMNSGIADAHNLGWKLAYALRHRGDAPALVASYGQERRTAILRGVERSTDALTRLLTAQPLSRRLLGGVLRFFLGMDPVLNRILPRLALLDTHYDNSNLLLGAHPAVGQHAHDVPLLDAQGGQRTLRQRQGQRPLLIIFDQPNNSRASTVARAAAQALHVVKVLRILPANCAPTHEGALVDTTGALWKQCEAQAGTVALLRPDGHLGWVRHQSPDTVAATCAVIRQALGLREPRRRGRVAVQGRREAMGDEPVLPAPV